MSDVRIRELGDDDADGHEFVDELVRLDERVHGVTLDDLRRWDEMVGAHLRLLAEVDGRVAAVASASGMPYDDTSLINLGLVVDPRYRRCGLGTRLLDRLQAWAAEHRDAPRLSVAVPHDDHDSLDWWARRGFTEAERVVVTEARLAEITLGDGPAIDGITFSSLAERGDLRRATYDAVDAMRRDMPGEFVAMQPFEEWVALVDDAERPASSVILAVTDQDQVVGAATVNLSAGDPNRAHVGFLGVTRDWRGRGVAMGLKHHQLRWCRDAGYELLQTINHDDNAAMRRINERAGFQATSIQVVLHRAAR